MTTETKAAKPVGSLKATGEKKVTKKHVGGPKMPVKLQHTFISAVGDLKNALSYSIDHDYVAWLEDDHMVTISILAKPLKALLAAHAQCATTADDDEL